MIEDPDKVTYFAQTNSRGKEVPFGIKRKDRARHMYVIGKTGMGKSTLLENMAIQDIRNGEGIAFIDPHGATAERILEYVPEHRVKDVLYFAPFDMEYPVAFNIMEDVGYDKRHLVVSGLLSAFRKIWGPDTWSARMEYILSNTLLALLEYPDATIIDVNRMLINKAFRKKVIERITDPIVKSFWAEEFANYTDRYTQEATPAIQNKIGQFTSNPLIRNIVGQPKSSFDLRQIMDEKKIVIINLSKGRVGEVNTALLGSMLVTKLYLAAMSRADVSAAMLATLPNFYFYVDEFQTFANESFADILSEARKYKLNLLIAHQYIEQMEEEVRNAVFGNVGTTISFRVGPFDAEVLETVFLPQFTKEDLVNLGFAQIYLTLMIDGVGSQPFSAATLPPFDLPSQRFVAEVLSSSRKQYGKDRVQVEKTIEQWQSIEAQEAREEKVVRPKRSPQTEHTLVRERPLAPSSAPAPLIPHTAPSVSPTATFSPAHIQPNRPQQQKPRAPIQTEGKHAVQKEVPPPISGALSLREAIEKATGEKTAVSSAPHAPSLKEALKKIVPPSQTGTPPQHVEAVKPPNVNAVGEKELRDMLQVNEIDIPQ